MAGLSDRKLKIWSSAAGGDVTVYQDGTAVDADASAQFDNAFRAGAQISGTTKAIDREYVRLGTLESSFDNGRQFSFSLVGFRTWARSSGGTIRLQPNDFVEFFAKKTGGDATVDTAAWHLNSATAGDQVRIFVGFVETIESSPEGGVTVLCREPTYRADDLILSRPGIAQAVPKLSFNLSPADADWYWCVKVVDTGATPTYDVGESGEPVYRMTVGQILTYLWDRYEAELVGMDVIGAGVDLFDATDLASLTMKPGPLTFERTGFASAVRELLRWAPDRRMFVDHQTGQWRIVPWGAALKKDSTTLYQHFHTTGNPYVDVLRVPLAALSYFSATPGADGNRVRVYDYVDPTIAEEFSIHSITTTGPVGGEVELRTNAALRHQVYGNASVVVPVRAETFPTAILDADDAKTINVSRDLEGCFSAVSLYSVHQKTETVSQIWYEGMTSPRLKPAWDRGFDQYWTKRDHEREADWGRAKTGIKVYAVDNASGKDRLKIRYSDLQYRDDHAADEWAGLSLWVWSNDGGTSVRGDNTTFTILSSTATADVGDGSPGLLIVLDDAYGDFATAVGDFKMDGGTDIGTPAGGTADVVVFTSDFRFATTLSQNKRAMVGKFWWFDDADHTQDATSGRHVDICSQIRLNVQNAAEQSRTFMAQRATQGYPATNWKPKGNFEYVGGGGPGTFLIWRRRAFVAPTPVGDPCPGGRGWTAPVSVQATVERTRNDVRSARVPSSGYAGHVWAAYGLSRELYIPVDAWDSDEDDATFSDLAERLWNAFQQAHHRGTLEYVGASDWMPWLDLCVRMTPRLSHYESSDAAGLEGFWGSLTGVSIDLSTDVVRLDFDSSSGLEKLLDDTYFKIFKVMNADPRAAIFDARKAMELANCLAGLRGDEGPSSMCTGTVYTPGNRPSTPGIKIVNKDDQNNGIVPTGIAMPDASSAGGEAEAAGNYATHGPRAYATVVRDLRGNYWSVGHLGEIVGGDEAAGIFTPAADDRGEPYGLPDRTEDEATALAAMWGGMQLPHEDRKPIFGVVGAGSTTTSIVVDRPALWTLADATGWKLALLDYVDGLERELLDLDALAAGAITLASALASSDLIPAENTPFILIPPGQPVPSSTDFADGSVGFQDGSGNWYVVEPDGATGSVYRASLSGSTLSKVSSGSGTLVLSMGPTPGNANVTVEIDFTGRTVTGLSGGGGGTDVDFGLVTEGSSSSLDWGAV